MSFATWLDSYNINSRDGVMGVYACVDETAKELLYSVSTMLRTLDILHCPGIGWSHSVWVKERRVCAIEQGKGVRVYTCTGYKYETDEYAELEQEARQTAQCRVNATGAVAGSSICGQHCVSKGAVLKIVSGSIPPSGRDLTLLRAFYGLWQEYLARLASIPHMRDLDKVERCMWLLHNEYDGDYDLSEAGDARVHLTCTGQSSFANLEQEVLDGVLMGCEEGWKLSHLRSLFPRKPGSKAARHTLIFLRHFWQVSSGDSTRLGWKGWVYDMGGAGWVQHTDKPVHVIKLLQGELVVALPTPCHDTEAVVLQLLEVDVSVLERVRHHLRGFTPAGHKSLLQKIIRYRPEQVQCGMEMIPAATMLGCTWLLLYQHPGSFVPDIQRFVSGRESACKRLLVSILEDAWGGDYSLWRVSVMAVCAQRIEGWRASREDVQLCISLCRQALSSHSCFIHNITEGMQLQPYRLDPEASPLHNVSSLLDEMKSFATDLGMVRWIAHNGGRSEQGLDTRPETMPLSHSVDQHWLPEIVHLLPYSIVTRYAVQGSRPFSKLYKLIFSEVTGVNSRKTGTGLSNRESIGDTELIQAVKKAQVLLLRCKQDRAIPARCKATGTRTVKPKLPVSWISGMAGPLYTTRPNAMVTLGIDDPRQLYAVRRPSRGLKDPTLSDKDREAAIDKAREMLAKGVPLKSCIAPLPWLAECRLVIRGDRVQIVRGKRVWSWKDVQQEIVLPVFEVGTETSLETVLLQGVAEEGIAEGADQTFEAVLHLYPVSVWRRLVATMCYGQVKVAKFSKDGGGSAEAVVVEDVGVCQLLLYLSYLYPAMLKRDAHKVDSFTVVCVPLWNNVKEMVTGCISKSGKTGLYSWPVLQDQSGRVLKPWQREAVEEMMEKHSGGGKGHFLWCNVGAGKTLAALTYLSELSKVGELPPYIIYSLPKSALSSILQELQYFKMPVNLLHPLKSLPKQHKALCISKDTPIQGHVNVIEHDHLRLMTSTLLSVAAQSIIVMDEVHKALNETKRTSVALELCRLSLDLICLTGTPVVDSNTYKLIWWLRQVVPFDVGPDNFWVAAQGMINKRLEMEVVKECSTVLAEMTRREEECYTALVPPGLGGSNTHASQTQISEAFQLCYDVCDAEIVRLVVELVQDGKAVFVVARNNTHQERVRELLCNSIDQASVFCITGQSSICLTDSAVESGQLPDYRVVITTQALNAGYTLTRCCAMVTGVYPSNQATREQLEGRICRVGQRSKTLWYYTVHCGILTAVLQRHSDAASLSAVLDRLTKESGVE